MSYKIYDLAEQAVYSKTHQLILFRRAVYVYVWRAGHLNLANIKRTVSYWMGSLQNRIPGFSMMLVVTHIDQVESAKLNEQCL